MEQVRLGLEAGIDVSEYADTFIDAESMKKMRLNLERGDKSGDTLNELQQQEIIMGLGSGIDVSLYADARYTFKQMEQIRLALEKGENPEKLLIYS